MNLKIYTMLYWNDWRVDSSITPVSLVKGEKVFQSVIKTAANTHMVEIQKNLNLRVDRARRANMMLTDSKTVSSGLYNNCWSHWKLLLCRQDL